MNAEQEARAELIHNLRCTVSPDWMQMQYADLPKPTPDHFWIHFTDMPTQGRDLFWATLLDQDLIAFVPDIQYQKRGDWMDSFPPACYRLTAKGRHVLDNPQEYVYAAGETP